MQVGAIGKTDVFGLAKPLKYLLKSQQSDQLPGCFTEVFCKLSFEGLW